jgi:pilus assembly protein Flp/PilA
MKVVVQSRRKPYAFDDESRTIVHMEAQSVTVSYEFLRAWIRAHVASERAASLVEYALLVALIAVVCIAAVTTLGKSASSKFSTVGASIDAS